MSRRFIPVIAEHVMEFGAVGGTPVSLPEVPPYIAWNGPSPRLATADGADSYLHIDRLQDAYALPMATVELGTTLPDWTTARIHTQLRVEGTPVFDFIGEAYVFDAAGNIASAEFEGWVGSGWLTFDAPLVSFAHYPSEGPTYASIFGPFFLSEADRWDVSWIAVSVAGVPPLQWRSRTDELGTSGVRPARSAATYQATRRARGMI